MADAPDLLAFEPAEDAAGQQWAQAEKACLKFPELFLQKARELNECRRELNKAWEEKERTLAFVLRNLITVADNCKAALAEAPAATEAPEEVRKPTIGEAGALASAQRAVLHLLEELGVVRVDLLGHTYEDVLVDGEKIEDPFEILESEQKGKSAEVKAREVVSDLWVSRGNGAIQVVRRGKVNC